MSLSLLKACLTHNIYSLKQSAGEAMLFQILGFFVAGMPLGMLLLLAHPSGYFFRKHHLDPPITINVEAIKNAYRIWQE